MDVFRSIAAASGRLTPSAVAIGNFDGVHLGHQALFASAKASAKSLTGRTVALTFEPHPGRVISPALAPRLLTTLERKLELFAEAGVDAAVIQPFDAAFAALSAAAFANEFLLGALGARAVAVGPDFSFGRGREGNIVKLDRFLGDQGATLTVVPKVEVDGLPVSSTRIRELVLEGRVAAARQLLGRPYDLDGPVVTGMGRGRGLGWPTANVAATAELLPATGVYAVRVEGPFGELPGAVNLGRKPTFGDGQPLTVEAHLIGYAGPSLVGALLRVKFIERLRAELRFPSLEALVAQIRTDVADALRLASPPFL